MAFYLQWRRHWSGWSGFHRTTFRPGKLGESGDRQQFPCLRPVRPSISIAIASSSILSAIVLGFEWVELCGWDRDPGNRLFTSGKWIGS